MQAAMLTMVAYGREANFSYPPRPADPKLARLWSPEWTTKVRFKSSHMAMLGMDAGAMAAPDEGPGEATEEAAAPPRNESMLERARRLMRERARPR
jgi:hypothetical protein